MRWRFWRHRDPKPSLDAQAAVSQADRAMVDAERLDCAVQEIVERLRVTRTRNHFAEAVERAVRRAT